MRVGYIKDENGNLVRKFIKEADVHLEENKDVLYQVSAQCADYAWTDEEHLAEAKEALLDSLCNKIRNLAKLEEFWVVKRENDYREDALKHPFFENGMVNRTPMEEWIPQEAKDGKISVAWEIEISSFNRLCPYDDVERIDKQIIECLSKQ